MVKKAVIPHIIGDFVSSLIAFCLGDLYFVRYGMDLTDNLKEMIIFYDFVFDPFYF